MFSVVPGVTVVPGVVIVGVTGCSPASSVVSNPPQRLALCESQRRGQVRRGAAAEVDAAITWGHDAQDIGACQRVKAPTAVRQRETDVLYSMGSQVHVPVPGSFSNACTVAAGIAVVSAACTTPPMLAATAQREVEPCVPVSPR